MEENNVVSESGLPENIDFSTLMVGQIFKNIPDDSYPHLSTVGDTSSIEDKTGRLRACCRVIRTYSDPFTNETKKYDIKVTDIYPEDAEFIIEEES